jgi:hypothetical protein
MEYALDRAMFAEDAQSNDAGREEPYVADGFKGF